MTLEEKDQSKTTDMKTMVANRIREIREDQGLTQEEFATEVDISSQTVSLWERGKILPKCEYIYTICKESGYSPAYIVGLSEIPYIIDDFESLNFKIKTTRYIHINDDIVISKRKKHLCLQLDKKFLKRLEIKELLSFYPEEELNAELSLIEKAMQKYQTDESYLEIPILTYLTD